MVRAGPAGWAVGRGCGVILALSGESRAWLTLRLRLLGSQATRPRAARKQRCTVPCLRAELVLTQAGVYEAGLYPVTIYKSGL